MGGELGDVHGHGADLETTLFALVYEKIHRLTHGHAERHRDMHADRCSVLTVSLQYNSGLISWIDRPSALPCPPCQLERPTTRTGARLRRRLVSRQPIIAGADIRLTTKEMHRSH